jgi:flagellar protein FlaF
VNATYSAAQAYGASTPTRTPRAVEYELFGRVTRRLNTASADHRQGGSLGPLATALNDNLRLWSAIAADVSDPGNGLPEALRARLFYLWEFSRVHTRRVLAGKADAGVLVDINTAVMRGLRGERGAP